MLVSAWWSCLLLRKDSFVILIRQLFHLRGNAPSKNKLTRRDAIDRFSLLNINDRFLSCILLLFFPDLQLVRLKSNLTHKIYLFPICCICWYTILGTSEPYNFCCFILKRFLSNPWRRWKNIKSLGCDLNLIPILF